MKVYIRHTETQLFLADLDQWVKDEKQAKCFHSSLPAIDFCIANKIQQALILLRFGDPRYDIELRPFIKSR